MTVTGNAPPPYHLQGLRHCFAEIRQHADQGRVICAEKKWRWTGLVLTVIGWAARGVECDTGEKTR